MRAALILQPRPWVAQLAQPWERQEGMKSHYLCRQARACHRARCTAGTGGTRVPLQRPGPVLLVCFRGGCCRRLHHGFGFLIERSAENAYSASKFCDCKLNIVDTYKLMSGSSYFLLQFKWPDICCFWRRALHTVFTGLELYEFTL